MDRRGRDEAEGERPSKAYRWNLDSLDHDQVAGLAGAYVLCTRDLRFRAVRGEGECGGSSGGHKNMLCWASHAKGCAGASCPMA